MKQVKIRLEVQLRRKLDKQLECSLDFPLYAVLLSQLGSPVNLSYLLIRRTLNQGLGNALL
jgi:hypothetical protein